MMGSFSIAEAIKAVYDSSGIRREAKRLDSLDKAENVFSAIAQARLPMGKSLVRQSRDIVRTLISWAYLLDSPPLPCDYAKGILLKGPTGSGKTLMMKTFADFLDIDKILVKCNGKQVPMLLKVVQTRELNRMNELGDIKKITEVIETPFLCLDDIGAEALESRSYGNKRSMFSEVLDRRDFEGLITFGTTNLNSFKDTINGVRIYDDRTVSRICGSFNAFVLDGDDHRIH